MSGLLKRKKKAAPPPAPVMQPEAEVTPTTASTDGFKGMTAAQISDQLQAEKEAGKPAPEVRVKKPTKKPSEEFIAKKKREERIEREESRVDAEERAESQRLQRRKRLRRIGGMRMLFSPLRREGPGYGRRTLLGV